MDKGSKTCVVWAQDLHLLDANWKHHPRLRGDSYHSLNQIIDHTVCLAEDGVEVSVVLGGDTFNTSHPSSSAVTAFTDAMKRLYSIPDVKPVKVYYIQGQHDRADPPWPNLAPNCIHLHQRKVRLGPFVVYGLDYTNPGLLRDEMGRIPEDANVLVIHQTLKDVVTWGGDIQTTVFPKHIRMVLAGDYHYVYDKKYASGVVMSSGSTHMRSIDEDPEKFFFELDEAGVRKVRLETRAVGRWVLETEEELLAFLNYARDFVPNKDMPPTIATPIWDVKYNLDLDEVLNRIEAAVEEQAFLFHSVISKEAMDVDRPALQSSSLTLESVIGARVNPEEDSELFGFVLDLMKTDRSDLDARLDEEETKRELIDRSKFE